MTNKIFTVSELTLTIKSILETNFRSIELEGEISNIRFQSSGHVYFSLKDEYSQISVVLFRGIQSILKEKPKDGDKVIIKGELTVYPPRGTYQIIVKELKFAGIGDLLLRFQQLKEKLKNKGYFDSIHKKALPFLPKRIGVITSPTGAVIQDILNVLKRRFFNFNLILNPVKVQGDGAAEEIAQAIYDFNKYNLADVLIIGRGGGSLEDLWAFNEEIVADAIFSSKIPIISAVGHQTDFTIADFVADIRAPTPSAAAEIVLAEKLQLIKNLQTYSIQLRNSISNLLKYYNTKINNFRLHPIFSSSYYLLGQYFQQLDEFKTRLNTLIKHTIEIKKENFSRLISHLSSINPKNLLKRGYSIIFCEKEESIILSVKDIRKDQEVKVLMNDGKIKAKVINYEKF